MGKVIRDVGCSCRQHRVLTAPPGDVLCQFVNEIFGRTDSATRYDFGRFRLVISDDV